MGGGDDMSEKAWQPPKGAPSYEQLRDVVAKLHGILEGERGMTLTADPGTVMYRVVAVERILLDLDLVTEEQLAYYELHSEFVELARAEQQSRPKPRIIVPGRDT